MKSLFYTGLAALALSACSNKEIVCVSREYIGTVMFKANPQDYGDYDVRKYAFEVWTPYKKNGAVPMECIDSLVHSQVARDSVVSIRCKELHLRKYRNGKLRTKVLGTLKQDVSLRQKPKTYILYPVKYIWNIEKIYTDKNIAN